MLTEIGAHVREGADAALTDPAAIRAQFEADAAAEALKPENAPLVQWAHELTSEQRSEMAAEFAAAEARSDEL